MDRHKCDMCGMYLHSDGAACEQCQKRIGVVKKTINQDQIGGYDGRENKDRNTGNYVSLE
ncbi:hypothetical protein [Lacrimispora sp.]|uniref:hypothetical protein n=1 Tax=Lacrimispora sp. TaxID=2719234 RepID=UPI002FDAD630